MKSSSKLFPVSLMRADVVAEHFIEDTYLVKPNNSLDLTVEIAVTRLGAHPAKINRQQCIPVILLHGSFTNRGFWFSGKGKGLAKALLEAGFDPWMVEARGHGDSPENQTYVNNNVEAYAKYDLPAIQQFVYEQTQQPAIWLGHSLGGVTIATALAGGHLDGDLIKGITLFGSQVSKYSFLLRIPFVRMLTRGLLLFKSRISGNNIGPEQEPIGIAKEYTRWAGWLHGWKPKGGESYWKGLQHFDIPLLAFAAKKDRDSPIKSCKKLAMAISESAEFVSLGSAQGFSKDFGHIDMVISKEAEQEVWPRVIDWIASLKSQSTEIINE